MIDILIGAGIPIVLVVVGVLGWYLFRTLSEYALQRRMQIDQELLRQRLAYLDQQLDQFYLPIRERFRLSKLVFEKVLSLKDEDGIYHNDRLGIQSDSDRALRNIVVHRLYLPLNEAVGRLILDKSFLQLAEDKTDYSKILTHYRMWSALETSVADGEISWYEAKGFLKFPDQEVEKFHRICDSLEKERNVFRSRMERTSRSMLEVTNRRTISEGH